MAGESVAFPDKSLLETWGLRSSLSRPVIWVLLAASTLMLSPAGTFAQSLSPGQGPVKPAYATAAPSDGSQSIEGMGTRRQPFVVREKDPIAAQACQRRILREIGRARSSFWRTLSRSVEESGGGRVEQVKVQLVRLEADKVVRDTVNFYFDVTGVSAGASGDSGVWRDVRPEGMKASLPVELGWLHLDSIISNEGSNPGLGWTFGFGAPGMKATVYIYDRGADEVVGGPESALVRNEFESARRDLLSLNSSARPLEEATTRSSLLTQYFRLEDRFTVLAVATSQGYFAKLRLTLEADETVAAMAGESFAAFARVVALKPQQGR